MSTKRRASTSNDQSCYSAWQRNFVFNSNNLNSGRTHARTHTHPTPTAGRSHSHWFNGFSFPWVLSLYRITILCALQLCSWWTVAVRDTGWLVTWLVSSSVKLSLSTPFRQTGEEEIQLHSSVTSAPARSEWLTSRPDRFTPGKNPGTHYIRRLGGPESVRTSWIKKKNLFTLPGWEPRIVKPVA